MGAESFVPAVNNLFGRLDANTRENQIDLPALLAKQNLLRKQQYDLEMMARAKQQDDATRSALSGIQGIEQVPEAIPAMLRSGDVQGATGLMNAYGQVANRGRVSGLDQIKFQGELQTLTTKIIPFIRANPDAYPAVRQNMIQQGIDPAMLPDLRDPNEILSYLDNVTERLAPYRADKMKIQSWQEGDENVTYQIDSRGNRVEVGRGPKFSDREGIELTAPDGTRLAVGGRGKQSSTGLQPAVQTEVEKDLKAQTENLARMKEVRTKFDPKFATYAGQAKGMWYKIKEKAGSELPPTEKEYANKFYTYRAEAGQMQADVMRTQSGTAVTPTEEKRQQAYLIDPGTGVFDGDSPEQVKAKLDRFEAFSRRSVARLNYVRKNGLSIRNIPLNTDGDDSKMDRIIQERAEIIEGKLKASGMPKEKIVEETARQTAEYFGLVY